ncbi:MAG: creatininase family protein [Woeseiaceae bacterium]|nr:creatininase family protein [Woeseiaceae bacterium]
MFDKGRYLLATLALVIAFAGAAQQSSDRQAEIARKLSAPNPLEPSDSIWIEELTYMEVRDRIARGATTAIIATGGIEENGPYLATGKHNVILQAMCPAIAMNLGNALCAPIVPFVPEGNIDPPSGAMHFPGSITVRDQTFHALLVDIGESLRLHGFTDIVLIGDSGGNQRGMEDVAFDLNNRWRDSGVRAHFVGEFYTPGWEETETYTEDVLGVSETRNDGHHDDIWVTAMMMVTDPSSVRYHQRVVAGLASINGVDIAPMEETIELGKKMVQFRAGYTAEVIRRKIGNRREPGSESASDPASPQ